MDKAEAKKRIEKLKKVISRHSYLYHVLDKPEISDAAWDSLKQELVKLEQRFSDLITPDSPTQRVSGKPLDKFKKVRHKTRMLSLQDVFSVEDFNAWEERIKKLVPNKKPAYFAELKIDGFAISLVYKNGILAEGSTRGDGRTGEDVTMNLKTIESIPLKLELREKIPFKLKDEMEIRGEVYMDKKAFEKANKERKKKNLPLYANPRNTAAGSIRQLDPKIAASRKLNFLAYDVVTDVGQKTHQEEHRICRALGFRTDEGKQCRSVKDVIGFRKEIEKKRDKLPYQIDGIVVNVNDNRIFGKLGVVGKAPRGAVAFKFAPMEVTTVVEDIKVQVGRTGALTPVAVLKPVQIGGTTVTRATLHNEDEIKKLDVRIGDTVIVQRAGDVIPDVTGVIKKLRTGKEKKFQMPEKCPVCGSKVVRPKGEAVHRCSSRNCGAQQRQRIFHFVSKKGFNIDGLGPKIINQLMDEGLVSNPADIFVLKEGDLAPLERFGEKSAANLIESIRNSKEITLSNFIFALGIRHVGEETAMLLARKIRDSAGYQEKNQNINNLIIFFQKQSLDDLQGVKDVGEVVGKSVYDWFKDKKNIRLLKKLNSCNIKVEMPKLRAANYSLQGKTFVLTGELESLTRDQAKDKIRELGGDVSGSVSKNTDYVVLGENPGSKYAKAKKLKLKIISEKEFLGLIK